MALERSDNTRKQNSKRSTSSFVIGFVGNPTLEVRYKYKRINNKLTLIQT